MEYQPTPQERDRLFKVEKTRPAVCADFELMMAVKEYTLKDLEKPTTDPAIDYIHQIKKVAFDSLIDIRIFEQKSRYTIIFNSSNATKEDLVDLEELKTSIIEEARITSPEDKVIETAWADVLFRQLRDQMPNYPKIKNLLKAMHLTQAFTRDPNGWAIKRGESSIIVLDATLKLILEYIGGFLFQCKQRVVDGENDLGFEWLTEHLLPAVLYFTADFPASRLPWILAPTQQSALYNKVIVSEQIKFIIAHELGHIFLGHLGSNTVLAAVESAGGKKFQSKEVAINELSRQNELAADQFAVNFCKSVVINNIVANSASPDTVQSISVFRMSIELLFLTFNLIEEATRILLANQGRRSPMEGRTHPRSSDRLAAIRDYHGMDILNDGKTIIFADAVFTEWLRELEEKHIDMENAEKWLNTRPTRLS